MGFISRSRSQNSGIAQVCAPLEHSLINNCEITLEFHVTWHWVFITAFLSKAFPVTVLLIVLPLASPVCDLQAENTCEYVVIVVAKDCI